MKHPIEQAFERTVRDNPYHSSLINFSRAIKGRRYERGVVLRYFRKLVEKDDYEGLSVEEVIKFWLPTYQNTAQRSHSKFRVAPARAFKI